jgi:eukaryotic-like serine/threonine-protein kinase
LRKLQHRAIVPLIEAGLDAEQNPYILMPLIEGKDLRTALLGANSATIIGTFCEILEAIQFAHEKNVIHRDLKPSNILVRTADSQPIILDFGCAYFLDDASNDVTTTLIGTSRYVPYEVFQNPKHRDVRQDVYACGMMLYEVIANKLPPIGEYVPLGGAFPFAGMDDVIKSALASEELRTKSAREMQMQLQNLVS